MPMCTYGWACQSSVVLLGALLCVYQCSLVFQLYSWSVRGGVYEVAIMLCYVGHLDVTRDTVGAH